MRRRIAILIALTTLSLFPAAGSAGAQAPCSSALDLPEALQRANVVFVGRVVDVSTQRHLATMKVQAVWKGPDLPEQVEVDGNANTGSADPRTFQQGSTYLVFPTNRTPPFADHKCTATRIFNATGLLIPVNLADAVGASSARPPILAADLSAQDDGGGGGIPPAIGIMMVLLGLVMLAIFGYQRFAGGKRRTKTDVIGSQAGRGAAGIQRSKVVKRPSPITRAKDAFFRAADERRFKRARKRARR